MTIDEYSDGTTARPLTLRDFSWGEWFASPIGFASYWFQSRRYKLLLGGIPALLMGLMVMAGVLSRPFYSNEAKAERYTAAAQVAAEAEDYDRADLYYSKLYDLGSMDEPTAYDAALVTEAAGRMEDAIVRMSRLAPNDTPGYAEAHLWLAKALLAEEVEVPESARNQLVSWHLSTAAKSLEDNLEPNFLLSRHNAQLGNLEDAVEALEKVVIERPQLNYELAGLQTRRGKKGEADQAFRTLVQLYQRWEKQGRDLNADQHLRLADALASLGDLPAAERRLLLGQNSFSEDERFRPALSNLALREIGNLRGGQEEYRADELALLQKAILIYPKNVPALQRLAQLTAVEGEEAEKARELLRPILASGQAPAAVHLVLGSLHAEEGDNDLAAMHLEQACRLSPMSAPALNNLAWVLANSSQPKLERAVELATTAIEQQPSVANFLETRGQIYIKMERWKDAVTDLELALARMEKKAGVHAALAVAYRKLGDEKLAQLHEEAADVEGS